MTNLCLSPLEVLSTYTNRRRGHSFSSGKAKSPPTYLLLSMGQGNAVANLSPQKSISLRAGHIYLIRIGQRRTEIKASPTDPILYDCIYFKGQLPPPLLKVNQHEECLVHRALFFHQILYRCNSHFKRGNFSESEIWLKGALIHWNDCRHTLRPNSTETMQKEKIAQLCNLLRTSDQVSNLTQAAQFCSYSPSQFSRVFKQLTGQSFHQYLIDEKMRRACGYLSTGEFTITQIAERLGYRDSFHFSNQFKQRMGRPPSKYF